VRKPRADVVLRRFMAGDSINEIARDFVAWTCFGRGHACSKCARSEEHRVNAILRRAFAKNRPGGKGGGRRK